MSDVPPPEHSDLPTRRLMFFGTITASLSHELKNVLATINEYSGLLDDLTQAAVGGKPLSPERLQSFCAKIAKQIKRSEVLIQRLNRFAHSVDDPLKEVDVESLLVEIKDLTNRFAVLKQVKLETRFPGRSRSVTTDPFGFQQAVFLAIHLAFEAAADKRLLHLAYETDGGCRVIVESADSMTEPGADHETYALLCAVMHQLGGQVVWGQDRIVLSFA